MKKLLCFILVVIFFSCSQIDYIKTAVLFENPPIPAKIFDVEDNKIYSNFVKPYYTINNIYQDSSNYTVNAVLQKNDDTPVEFINKEEIKEIGKYKLTVTITDNISNLNSISKVNFTIDSSVFPNLNIEYLDNKIFINPFNLYWQNDNQYIYDYQGFLSKDSQLEKKIPREYKISEPGSYNFKITITNKFFNTSTTHSKNFRVRPTPKLLTFGSQIGSAAGELSNPGVMRLDIEGNLYVKDGGIIKIFDNNGVFIKDITLLDETYQYTDFSDFFIDNEKNIFLKSNSKILKFSSEGIKSAIISFDNSDDNLRYSPYKISLNNNILYILYSIYDKENNFIKYEVLSFSTNGDYLSTIYSKEGYSQINSIFFDNRDRLFIHEKISSGNYLYYIDTLNNEKKIFLNPDLYGNYDYQIDNFSSIRFNSGNFILDFFHSYNFSYLKIFSENGEFIGKKNFNYWVENFLTDKSDNFFIIPINDYGILKFDPNLNLIKTIGVPDFNGQLSYANDIAIDQNNNLYIADTSTKYIQIFDGNGSFIKKYKYLKKSGVILIPQKIIIDDIGDIIISENNTVYIFDNNFNFKTSFGLYGDLYYNFTYIRNDVFSNGNYIFINDDGIIKNFDKSGNYISWTEDYNNSIMKLYNEEIYISSIIDNNLILFQLDTDLNLLSQTVLQSYNDEYYYSVSNIDIIGDNLYFIDVDKSLYYDSYKYKILFDKNKTYIGEISNRNSWDSFFHEKYKIVDDKIYIFLDNKVVQYDISGWSF